MLKRQVTRENERLLRRIYRQSRHHVVRQRAHCLLLRNQGTSVGQTHMFRYTAALE
jgi:hypothetical protein